MRDATQQNAPLTDPQRGGVEGSESQVAPGLLAGEERSAPSTSSEKRRGSALSPQDKYLLDQWGRQLREAFGDTAYLVGSAGYGGERHPRDVDVRMLLPKGAGWVARTQARLWAINVAVSTWGRTVTGLPIDFQFQPADDFHAENGYRSALGISPRVRGADRA